MTTCHMLIFDTENIDIFTFFIYLSPNQNIPEGGLGAIGVHSSVHFSETLARDLQCTCIRDLGTPILVFADTSREGSVLRILLP